MAKEIGVLCRLSLELETFRFLGFADRFEEW